MRALQIPMSCIILPLHNCLHTATVSDVASLSDFASHCHEPQHQFMSSSGMHNNTEPRYTEQATDSWLYPLRHEKSPIRERPTSYGSPKYERPISYGSPTYDGVIRQSYGTSYGTHTSPMRGPQYARSYERPISYGSPSLVQERPVSYASPSQSMVSRASQGSPLSASRQARGSRGSYSSYTTDLHSSYAAPNTM